MPRRLLLATLVLVTAPAQAQIPDKFTNLKVLPADISRNELVPLMRGVATALGVRCNHCHVGDPSGSLQGMDFATDEKETKKTARTMFEMVRNINGEWLTRVGADLQVECFTCHRGAPRPERLENVLVAAQLAGGPDSIVKAYRALREEYYGQAVFDFGDFSLISAAERMGRAQIQGAIRTLELQTEYFPESVNGWAQLGVAYAQAGDTARALTSVQRALSLAPDNRQLQGLLRRLRGEGLD